ncbi:helix-turn-helix domain-containing protein [Parabacteroides pacaensis]|uniref:hypothetical protein n=1 Tax=Parabacteroides pacaensis TaxID=2086575 RepID=UPI000D0F9CD0|nr:hypothetical protein [Parabacteroides pacaensis]
MNYIELINQFWRIRRYKPLTAYEADLYYYLMQECNNRKWLNPFNLSTNLICAELGIARKTLSDLRNRLKQKGLIDFVEGQKNKSNAVYKLIYVTEGNIQGNELGNIQGNHLNTKHKLNNIPPNPQQGEIGFPSEKPKRGRKPKVEFIPPTIEEVQSYFQSSGLPAWEIQAEKFFNHWNSQGWKKGTGAKITNWDSLANNWILTEKEKGEKDARSNGNLGSLPEQPAYGED